MSRRHGKKKWSERPLNFPTQSMATILPNSVPIGFFSFSRMPCGSSDLYIGTFFWRRGPRMAPYKLTLSPVISYLPNGCVIFGLEFLMTVLLSRERRLIG
jgi:hypothetical protein